LVMGVPSAALLSHDPQLVLLVGSALEQVHRGRPLGHVTGLCLWAKALAAVQAGQQPRDGWAMQACRYGVQPRLLWSRGASEGWRVCSAPLLSNSLQSFLAESLLLWDHGGRREQQVGPKHFLAVDLPALVLTSQALQVVLSVALVRTGNVNVARTFDSWYNAWGVGSTAVAMAFSALECSAQPDANNPMMPLGPWILPESMRPFACWQSLAISCLLSPSKLTSQGCAHISGIWAGLLWGKLAGGWRAPTVLQNGILTRPGYARDSGGIDADGRGPNAGHRLGHGEGWWARTVLVHAGITAAVLVLTHVAASRTTRSQGHSGRSGGGSAWQWPQWLAGSSASEIGSSSIGGLWDYIIIDNTASVAEARELLAGATEIARGTISAFWV
jgi:hypothetical protein